ncbi:hypothetical protein O0L34_g12971 [Tuta absoluta]|nr:hypothetical protein O0L34_g12971 [Tuta absoluta]
MKKLIEDFIKSQGLELNKVTSALKELQETTSKIENSLKFLSDQNSKYKNKIDQLENQLQDDKKYIAILENKLEDVQMGSRKSNFEIKNVPKKNNKNTEDLVAMVQCLSRTLDVQISKADIKDVYRIKANREWLASPFPGQRPEKNYLFCWTTHGKVFVRKNADSPVILIRSPEQIQQLLQEA